MATNLKNICLVLSLGVALIISGAVADEQSTTYPLPAPVSDADFRTFPDAQIELGRLLFYDRLLSWNFRISCATCHNHDRASSNGFRLDQQNERDDDETAIAGLEIYDTLRPSSAHAPMLFNIGAKEFSKLFSDGRIMEMADGILVHNVPGGLPSGLDTVLAAQALFPAITDSELAGVVDNDGNKLPDRTNQDIWDEMVRRVAGLEDYAPFVHAAYPELAKGAELTVAHLVNAIAAFEATEWRSDNSPFDAYLRGDETALNASQKAGLDLFYGKAGCAECHSGAFQTDHKFHAIAMPPWRFSVDGGTELPEIETGRISATNGEQDRFAFRTPSLRNITHTGPYGHAGAYETLQDAVQHHLNPVDALGRWANKRFKPGSRAHSQIEEIAARNTLKPIELTDGEIDNLVAFLTSLTDERALLGKLGKPDEVPSSLALD